MKRLILPLLVALAAASVSAEVVTTIRSYRFVQPLSLPTSLVRAEDGALFGMVTYAIYRWQADGTGFTVLKQVPVGSGALFGGRLAISGNTLYGATYAGGIGGGRQSVFRMNTDGTDYTVLRSGIPVPYAVERPGIVLSGDTLYGWGYKINTDGSGYQELAGFPAWDGLQDWHLDIQVSQDRIFGATTRDGKHGAGTVFSLRTDGSGYQALFDIPAKNHSNINDYLTLAGETLFGTRFGNTAQVFRIDTDGTGYQELIDDFSATGSNLSPERLHHSGGMLYGTSGSITDNHHTTALFRMDTQGAGYSVLKRLEGSLRILTVVEGTIYGLAQSPSGFSGGEDGLDAPGGALFRMNTDGTGFAVLHEFPFPDAFPDGRHPGSLTESGGMLYGVDYDNSGATRVFKMDVDGSGFTDLMPSDFPQVWFERYPLTVAGSTLFGIGGARLLQEEPYETTNGSLLRMESDGTDYQVLKEFTWPADAGESPASALAVSDTTLYGTINAASDEWGSPVHGGKIFKLNTDGTGYTILRTFVPTDDAISLYRSELVVSGNTLFGTDGGTVFRMDTDGGGFARLRDFPNDEVNSRVNPHLVLSGDTLFGTISTGYGDWLDPGSVFRLNTDGSALSVLKQFHDLDWSTDPPTNNEGVTPTVWAVRGDTLYGTTSAGGRFGFGTVFKVKTDGSGFAVIAQNGENTRWGWPSEFNQNLVLSGNALYWASEIGGRDGIGGIYRIDLTPTLSIARTAAGAVAVSWPSDGVDYVLQQNAESLDPLNWTDVAASVEDDGTTKTTTLNPDGDSQFFRLVEP